MAEKKNIEVVVGKKAEGEADAAKTGKDASGPPQDEVGGRRHGEYVLCPWCGSVRFVFASDVRYERWICGHCGHSYIK
jgi:ribosomal protein S27AE